MHTDGADLELLQEYARNGSDAAFQRLVERHVAHVHSMAHRQTGDAHLAQDVTQAVFLILARKANSIPPTTVLAGWLYKTTGFVAKTVLRTERRRRQRETVAMESGLIESESAEVWEHVRPLLDESLASLRDKDRDAVLLRFFHEQSVRDVAAALGTSEQAAQKRIARAVEKLRRFFDRRGVTVTGATLMGVIAANATQAAPPALPQAIAALISGSASAVSGSAAGALALSALKSMTASALVIPALAAAAVLAALATGITLLARSGPGPRIVHDVSQDFSLNSNPNGVWTYGWTSTIGGVFNPMRSSQSTRVDVDIQLDSWQRARNRIPAVYFNAGSATRSTAQGSFPPGAVWFHPGDNGQPENFAVIRFTVPAGAAGDHRISVRVEPNYHPAYAGDTDFHVVRSGIELFGEYLSVSNGTGYTNTLLLKDGDTIDFMVGRGADGDEYASSLKIEASIEAPASP